MRDLSKILLSFSVALMTLLLSLPAAIADETTSQIAEKNKAGMSEYDGMEFEKARDLLEQAIEHGENNNSQDDALATAYLNLGVVLFSGLDLPEEAAEAFQKAININANIQLDVAYSTPELATMLDEARAIHGSGGTVCPADGIQHELVDEVRRGSLQIFKASVGRNVKFDKVVLFWRAEGQVKFTKVILKMKADSNCEYVGTLPKEALKGDLVHYYIAAIDKDGKEVESKGSHGSPNIIEVIAGALGVDDEDNPFFSNKPDGDDDDDLGDKGSPSVFISIGVGTGSGYVNGPTEKKKSPLQDCPSNICLAASWLHVIPEIGFYLSSKSSISLAFRAGFPLGANVSGHATFAPAGLLRFRRHFDESGEGLQFNVAVGGGLIRNTIRIDNAPSGKDTDTTVMGPLLFGAGFGYSVPISSSVKLVGEVNAIGAFTAGVKDLGSCPGNGCAHPKNGVEMDATLSFLLAL